MIHKPPHRSEFIHERGERWLDEGGARDAAQFVASRAEPVDNFPLEQAPEHLRVLLTGLVMESMHDENSDYSLLTRQLERRRLEKTRDDLSRRIARAVEAGDDDEFRRLGHEKIRIDKEIESV